MRIYGYTDEDFAEDMRHDTEMEPLWAARALEYDEVEDEEE